MQQEKSDYIRALNSASQWLAYGSGNDAASKVALSVMQDNARLNVELAQYRSASSKGQTAFSAELATLMNRRVASILSTYAEWFKVWHSATPSENAGQF